MYVNGVRVGTYSGTAIGQNNHLNTNVSGQTARIGQDLSTTPNNHMQGYLAQTVFLDNKSIANGDLAITDFLDTFTFGTNGSQRIPKSNTDIIALASAAGNNSFCLDYSDSSNIVNDASSKGNNFTPTGGGSPTITSANQSVNTPSKVYPIVNALTKVGSAASTLEEGNTKATVNDNGGIVITPKLPFSGLWYFEINVTTNSIWNPGIGQQSALGYNSTAAWNNTTAETHVWLSDHSGNFFNNNGSLSTYPIANPTTGRFAVAWDGDNRALYFGQISGSTITWTNSGDPTSGSSKTGAAPGNWPTTGTDPLYFIVIGGGTSVMEFDFDEDDWTGSTNRPAAAKALNSENLTAPDFQGIDYFDATLYEGNGTGQRVGDFVPFTDSETVANSIIFNDDDSAYLNRTYVTPTNAKKFTVAFWFKPGASTNDQYLLSTGPGGGAPDGNIYLNHSTGGGELWYADPNDGSGFGFRTARKFTDSSSWVHFCMGIDTTASSGSRLKVEINGVDQGQPSATAGSLLQNNQGGSALPTEPSLNQDMNLNKDSAVYNIGRRTLTSGSPLDGYLANYYFIDGEKLDASNFGQLDTSTNRWVPKAYSGNFNNNGWKLAFGTAPGTSNGAGTDTSGEDHHWTENNFTDSDQVIDSPSQNFATIDPVISNGATPLTLSEGNLTGVRSSSGFQQAYSSFSGFRMQENTGIYFAEVLVGSDTASFNIGVLSGDPPSSTNRYIGQDFGTYGYDNGSGNKVNNATGAVGGQYAAYGATYTAGDVIGIEIDTDTGSINFHKNGSDQGQAFTSVPGPYAFAIASENGGGPMTFNFGQQMVLGGSATTFNAAAGGRFKHTPPTGAKALNQDNLDDTASKLTAWAWIKNRDADDSHILVDRVRGVGEVLHSDATDLEATEPDTVQRFLQRGVQIGSDVQVNTANESYVLWQWLVGEAATTTTINASSTTPTNSIASTVAAADAGHFSVVGYQGNSTNGATVAHSLGGEPELIFFRGREGSGASSFLWRVFSTVGGAGKYLRLNDTTALQDDTAYLNNTLPGSVVFTLGTDGDVNNSSYTYIAYCFRSVPGVCKVGSYIGNNDNRWAYMSV